MVGSQEGTMTEKLRAPDWEKHRDKYFYMREAPPMASHIES